MFFTVTNLGIALSCLFFTVTNLKAMQYASPKAIWNLLLGASGPPFGPKEENFLNERIQQFVDYMSDLDRRGTATTVPEFPSKLDWLNTAPLQLRRDLKGKVVLLDFWTYCCINCMHVLPDLEFLEKKYKDAPFVVVGVHSAKFDNEKDLEAIRNVVLRYGVTHPVVNDGDMYLWRELGISSWPTFALVGPNGKLIAQVSGEGRRKVLSRLGHMSYDVIGAQILQTGIPASKANLIGATEVSFASLAESLMLGVAIIANDVSHFGFLVMLSLLSVVGAACLY